MLLGIAHSCALHAVHIYTYCSFFADFVLNFELKNQQKVGLLNQLFNTFSTLIKYPIKYIKYKK